MDKKAFGSFFGQIAEGAISHATDDMRRDKGPTNECIQRLAIDTVLANLITQVKSGGDENVQGPKIEEVRGSVNTLNPIQEPKIEEARWSVNTFHIIQGITSEGPTENSLEEDAPMTVKVVTGTENLSHKYYVMKNNPRGDILIININKFSNGDLRRGSEVDVTNIKNLFEEMGGYKDHIEVHQDLTALEICSTVHKFSKKDFSRLDISVVIIMSHGNDGGIIEGSDWKPVRESEIVGMFSEELVPTLRGKPKLFLFVCCRGQTNPDVENDARVISIVSSSTMKDIFILRPTAPGHLAKRNIQDGTYFIRGFCYAMMNHSHEMHFAKLVTKMQDHIDNHGMKQQIALETISATKKLYFNPIIQNSS